MKKNIKISAKKIFRCAFWAIILLFLLLLGLVSSFLYKYAYQPIDLESELLLSQRPNTQQNLDTKGMEEILKINDSRLQKKAITGINNIFD